MIERAGDERWVAWLVGVAATAVSLMLFYLGWRQYVGFNAKYFDLGAMSQAMWSVTQGKPLLFTGQGLPISRLARNVELFYFLLAPIYAVRPSPDTLLFIQAAMFGWGAAPVYRLAVRRLQRPAVAAMISLVYLFYPVAQTAVLAEFHADILAVPLLLHVIDAVDRSRWRGYWVWLALALSVKFYVAAPVAGLGLVLWRQGHKRVGVWTMGTAVLWGMVAFWGIRAYFAPAQAADLVEVTTDSYLGVRFQLDTLRQTVVPRMASALILFMPGFLLLGWRAWHWFLPALTIAVPALLSNDFGPSYSYATHHYALTVPFIIAAIVYGAAAQNPFQAGRVSLTLFVTFLFTLVFVDTPLRPLFFTAATGSGIGRDPSAYGLTNRDEFRREWLAETVPAGTAVAADELDAVFLTNRDVLYLTEYVHALPLATRLDAVDFVVTDVLYDYAVGDPNQPNAPHTGGAAHEHAVLRVLMAPDSEFKLLAVQDGLTFFGRSGESLFAQAMKLPPSGDNPPSELLAVFNDEIGLVAAEVQEIRPTKFQLRTEWVALKSLTESPALMAVSRVVGLDHYRLVHLPMLSQTPTTEWEKGDRILEIMEFTISSETPAQDYAILTGWYDTENLFAPFTDDQSRVGDEVEIDVIHIQ